MSTRTEHDSLGPVEVPQTALYGAQTQRAVDNFSFSGLTMPVPWLQSLARLKQSAARASKRLGELAGDKADAIDQAAQMIVDGEHLEHFPVDVFQTGSGTSSNMNMNEVLAHLAGTRSGLDINF